MAMISSSGLGAPKTGQAITLLLFLTILGALNLNILGYSISLVCVPLIGICLWPRSTHPVFSIFAIFLCGLLMDFLTMDALGLRSIVYLSVFVIFRPDKRLKPHIFGTAFAQWLGAILIALIIIYFLGWIAHNKPPQITALIQQAILATGMFPLIYALRYAIRKFADNQEDYF